MITIPLSSQVTADFLCVSSARWETMQRESLEYRSLTEQLTLTLLALGHDLRQDLHLLNGTVRSAASERTSALISRLARKCEQATAIAASNRPDKNIDPLCAVSVEAVLVDAYRHWHPEAERKGLSFRMRFPNVMVTSNAFWLGVIVSNLIGNAIQHTPSGGVTVDLTGGENHWLLTILDTGPGFPTVETPRSQRGNTGLGIGLQLVKQTAALLGHGLSISSSPSGSIVRLNIARGNARSSPFEPLTSQSTHGA